jgi:hypothetical protein
MTLYTADTPPHTSTASVDCELGHKLARLARLEAEVDELRQQRLAAQGVRELLTALDRKLPGLRKAPEVRAAFEVLRHRALQFCASRGADHG